MRVQRKMPNRHVGLLDVTLDFTIDRRALIYVAGTIGRR